MLIFAHAFHLQQTPQMDAYQKLKLFPNPDGTFTRTLVDSRVPPTGDHLPPGCSDPALSKDIPLNESNNTFIRIFRPISTADSKLPVLIYVHGGGFTFMSAASSIFHKQCGRLAAELPALVLSVEYRLAPEHPLPATYDDAVEALLWVRDQGRELTETWLDRADFSNCFIMGNSAGGNIAFNIGLRALNLDLNPIKLSGLILHQSAFSGEERTDSELRFADDKILPLDMMDLAYSLTLPEGANRDHEYVNPLKMRAKVTGLPRCFVSGYLRDPLIDRQRMLADMLEEEGVSVVRRLDQDGIHGSDVEDDGKEAALVSDVKRFVYFDAV